MDLTPTESKHFLCVELYGSNSHALYLLKAFMMI